MKEAVSFSLKDNPKKFWSIIKNKRQETTGVSPLKNNDGFIKSDSQSNEKILNNQFVSIFTQEDDSSLPNNSPSPYPCMPDITVNWEGVHHLLKRLKSFKATGPDSILAFVLKVAADEL